METTEEFLTDVLSRFPDALAILVTKDANFTNVAPTKVSDVRATAELHKLPLYETPSFVALSTYDGMTDQTIYRVVRK